MPKIASYFSKADRKKLFFDYLKLIGILEIVIFIGTVGSQAELLPPEPASQGHLPVPKS
jgi:hypothetical protein